MPLPRANVGGDPLGEAVFLAPSASLLMPADIPVLSLLLLDEEGGGGGGCPAPSRSLFARRDRSGPPGRLGQRANRRALARALLSWCDDEPCRSRLPGPVQRCEEEKQTSRSTHRF
ncbi:hypothetical protein MTO96_011315 [Rhipicephalus appendiculatus]